MQDRDARKANFNRERPARPEVGKTAFKKAQDARLKAEVSQMAEKLQDLTSRVHTSDTALEAAKEERRSQTVAMEQAQTQLEGKIGDAKMHLGKAIYSALVRARAPAPSTQPVARSRASACKT